MDLSHNVEIKKELDLRQEIAIRITHMLDTAIAVQQDLDLALEKALDQGILQRPGEGNMCPNCGAVYTGNFCPNCNQALEDPELLDHDSEAEDREMEDLSDSEDADDPWQAGDEEMDGREDDSFDPHRTVTFAECLEGCLRDCGVAGKDLPLFGVVVSALTEQEDPMPQDLPDALAESASTLLGMTVAAVREAWARRPFDGQGLVDMLDECLAESGTEAETPAQPAILLEIRKIGDAFVPLVEDRYEDLVIRAAARHKWIAVGPDSRKFHGNLVLMRKAQTKQILYKILETIIHSRRDFLEAKSREEAMEILRTRPFQQKEVVERHGIDKGVVARHFNDKPILTPHGLFILKDLAQQEALDQGDMTVPGLQDIVKLAIERTDREGKFYSDQKIKALIEAEGAHITARYVAKIRQALCIPNSKERKKASTSAKG